MPSQAVNNEFRKRSLGYRILDNPSMPIFLILVATIMVGYIVAPSFRQIMNFENLMVQTVAFALAGIAQTYVILAGDVDLGVGGMMSIAVCAAPFVMTSVLLSMIGGSLFVLLIGAVIGFITGYLLTKIKIEALVLTLAINTALLGFALYLMPFPDYTKIIPPEFIKAFTGKFLDIVIFGVTIPLGQLGKVPILGSIPVVGTFIIAVISWFVLNKTRFGLHVRAVGADRESAFRAGIKVERIKIATHTITGFLAALAGLFLAARMGTGDPTAGTTFSLDSMTAAVAGGCLLATGIGSVFGTLGGAFLIVILGNIFNHLGVSPFYQIFFRGLLLVVAVAGGALKKKWQDSRL